MVLRAVPDGDEYDKDIALAISEHYLPNGLESKVPKKPFSIALSLTDKLDTLVGFFGINEKPTSSKDPFALRRAALGIIRLIIVLLSIPLIISKISKDRKLLFFLCTTKLF